jgi:hypothetical protein
MTQEEIVKSAVGVGLAKLMLKHRYTEFKFGTSEIKEILVDQGYNINVDIACGIVCLSLVQEPIPYEEYKAAAGVKEDVQPS